MDLPYLQNGQQPVELIFAAADAPVVNSPISVAVNARIRAFMISIPFIWASGPSARSQQR